MNVPACDLGGTWMNIGVVRAGRLLAEILEPANSKAGLAPCGKVQVVASELGGPAAGVAGEWLLHEQFLQVKQ